MRLVGESFIEFMATHFADIEIEAIARDGDRAAAKYLTDEATVKAIYAQYKVNIWHIVHEVATLSGYDGVIDYMFNEPGASLVSDPYHFELWMVITAAIAYAVMAVDGGGF